MDPDLLRANFDALISSLQGRDYGSVVLHGTDEKPSAIILVTTDPEIASKLAALLPQIESRLGLTQEPNGRTATNHSA